MIMTITKWAVIIILGLALSVAVHEKGFLGLVLTACVFFTAWYLATHVFT